MAQNPTTQQPGPVTSGGRTQAHPDQQPAPDTGAGGVQPGGVHRPAPVYGVEETAKAKQDDQSKGGLNRPHNPGEQTKG